MPQWEEGKERDRSKGARVFFDRRRWRTVLSLLGMVWLFKDQNTEGEGVGSQKSF